MRLSNTCNDYEAERGQSILMTNNKILLFLMTAVHLNHKLHWISLQ